MRLIKVIDGESIRELDDGSVTYTAKFAVDTDGAGPMHGDPDGQHDTKLHLNGQPLNADADRYIVVPPAIVRGVKGIVFGCQAYATNTRNGRTSEAVVGDLGPAAKIGEGSRALAIALGIDPSPTSGGTAEHIIHYSLKPGIPACVAGKHYDLQPS